MTLKHAIKVARKGRGMYRHAVLVFRGGNIVAAGFNHDLIHAEVAALKKLWPSERRGVKILSIRLGRNGRVGMARPCKACWAFLREHGVKSVTYTGRNGAFVTERL